MSLLSNSTNSLPEAIKKHPFTSLHHMVSSKNSSDTPRKSIRCAIDNKCSKKHGVDGGKDATFCLCTIDVILLKTCRRHDVFFLYSK